jgi:adenylate cyclase
VPQDTYKRKLAAILSADVKGYSRLMGEDEDATIRTLTSYRNIMTNLIQQYRGRVVDSPGDNLLAEFSSIVDAVKCAVEIQKELSTRNTELPENRKMEYRIGINLGDLVEDGERIYGDGVNIAARVEGLAEGGGICISGTVYDQIENKLDLGYENLGEHSVKNISKPIRVYKIPIELEIFQEKDDEKSDPLVDLLIPDKPSIAVLPFTNMSGDPEQEYFSDGITEDIITALSRVPDMLVIARNSTFTYKGKAVKVQQVSKELGVRYVLEGSVRKAGNRVRITAQLIDATTGNHLWADRYDRELEDIFAIQDEITIKIVAEMQVALTTGVRARLISKGTDNIDAYQKLLQAEDILASLNPDEFPVARQLLEEVIELDPNWGRAYGMLGVALVASLPREEFPEKTIQRALELAQKAVTLDDNLLSMHHRILSIILMYQKRFSDAVNEMEKVVAMEPHVDRHYQSMGTILIWSGSPRKALEIFRKWARVSPFVQGQWLYHFYSGAAYFDLGEYDRAVTALNKSLKLNREPFHELGIRCRLAATYIMTEQAEKAQIQIDKIKEIDHSFSLRDYEARLPYENQSDKNRILLAAKKAGLD